MQIKTCSANRLGQLMFVPGRLAPQTSSILSALAGHCGGYHASPGTQGSRLWINPLMSAYWRFRHDGRYIATGPHDAVKIWELKP